MMTSAADMAFSRTGSGRAFAAMIAQDSLAAALVYIVPSPSAARTDTFAPYGHPSP